MTTTASRIRTFSTNKPLVRQRRREIARAAVKVFAKKGYSHAGMRDIARACGVTTGTLYYYVGSKRDILNLVAELSLVTHSDRFGELVNLVTELPPLEAIRQAIKVYLEHVNENQDLYIFLDHLPATLSRKEREPLLEAASVHSDYFSTLLERGIQDGEFGRVDCRFVAGLLVREANGWAHSRWTLRKRYTLEDYTDRLTELIMIALRNGAPEV